MLTIGLLGGMSWESSARYYRLLNEDVGRRLGDLHSARCLLLSLDFAEIERVQAEGRWEDAGTILADEARRLETAGADLLVLCTNTMHRVAGAIEAAVGIPLLHIGDVTAEAVRRAGLGTVGLLGTAYTMEQPFLREHLERSGLVVLAPEKPDRDLVHRVIYEELCRGIVRTESRAAFVEVVERLRARGAEGVILGCTEIELLISGADSPIPVFPTTELHARAAVTAALAG